MSQLQAQFAQIASAQNTHTPAFRLRGASVVGLATPGIDPVGGSAQTIILQAAHSNPVPGGGFTAATSAQFVPLQKADLSGAFSMLVSSGGFAIALASQLHAFDEFRVVASSAQANSVRSLTCFVKV